MDIVSYYITDEEKLKIDAILYNVISITKVDLIVVGDEGGRLISYIPQGGIKDEEIAERFCVICASIIGALQNLDNLIQMRTSLFTEGIDDSLYVKISKHHFFIATKFSKNVPIGTVKLFVEKAANQMDSIFENVRKRGIRNNTTIISFDDLIL